MPIRNLIILFFCQLISATGQITIVTLGGIIGSSLTENQSFATLPVSLMVVVTAMSTIPATMLMKKMGRKYGSSISSLSAVAAVLIAAFALIKSSFLMFIFAAALFGINTAFTQQYRFAAAESVQSKYTARAISIVLLGAIGGALLGPELVIRGQYWYEGAQYSGTLLALSVLFVFQAILLLFLGSLKVNHNSSNKSQVRSINHIIKQPVFIMAVFGATIAYGSMTFIMTATPLSMHVIDGYSINITANIIRSHVLAMYIPSLFSGLLIEKFGTVKIMSVGALSLLGACLCGFEGQAVNNYWIALVLLGVGWNFLYIGGTTMLTFTYATEERFKVQGINELCIFGTSAVGSLLAGTIMYIYGWFSLVILPIPFLLLVLLGLYITKNNQLLTQ